MGGGGGASILNMGDFGDLACILLGSLQISSWWLRREVKEGRCWGGHASIPMLSPMTQDLMMFIRHGRNFYTSLKVLGSMYSYTMISLKFWGFVAAGVQV